MRISNARKAVIAISTRKEHRTDTVDPEGKHVPEIINYYNHNKIGVDTVNKLKETYSTARMSNR